MEAKGEAELFVVILEFTQFFNRGESHLTVGISLVGEGISFLVNPDLVGGRDVADATGAVGIGEERVASGAPFVVIINDLVEGKAHVRFVSPGAVVVVVGRKGPAEAIGFVGDLAHRCGVPSILAEKVNPAFRTCGLGGGHGVEGIVVIAGRGGATPGHEGVAGGPASGDGDIVVAEEPTRLRQGVNVGCVHVLFAVTPQFRAEVIDRNKENIWSGENTSLKSKQRNSGGNEMIHWAAWLE